MNINDTYIDFVSNIIKHGDNVIKDDGDKIIELLGNHYFIDNPLNDMVLFSSDDHLLQCIKRGMFDVPGNPINSMALYNYVSEGFEECFVNRSAWSKYRHGRIGESIGFKPVPPVEKIS